MGARCGIDTLVPGARTVNAHRLTGLKNELYKKRGWKSMGRCLRSVTRAIFELVGVVVGRNVLGNIENRIIRKAVLVRY